MVLSLKNEKLPKVTQKIVVSNREVKSKKAFTSKNHVKNCGDQPNSPTPAPIARKEKGVHLPLYKKSLLLIKPIDAI